jgi:hypothetical protein
MAAKILEDVELLQGLKPVMSRDGTRELKLPPLE